ncbi:zinc-dependent metalloprotease [Faecalibacter bovis]|uniref:T9SS type A sorting domain-containing protein n=1 Tax=Faecalibacter bovis TaxID=2898187 RepID=A0ABX7XEF2_9FLAO|nr:zinc-dependent metalloprotease [Faecalibacter bovis]QTV06298.1 T9SS type A sorting domain-containing protein [Faecalibacter bovis]
MKRNLFCIGLILSTFTTSISAQENNSFIPSEIAIKNKVVDLSNVERVITQSINAKSQQFSIKLPSIDAAKTEQFILVERQLLSEELQQKYPSIKSYTGYSTSNPNKRISLSYSPTKGINSIVYDSNEKYIIEKIGDNYEIFTKETFPRLNDFNCGDVETLTTEPRTNILNNPATYRKYRLAVVTDYEFNRYVTPTSQTPTYEHSLAAIVQTMTYVTPVYENDLSITFELVNGLEPVTYLTAESDPYSSDLNGETQVLLDTHVGAENYDVGMLFTQKTGGGNAGAIGSVCNDTIKGSAYSGGINYGYPVFAYVVAHEMGHQFGANHTHARNEGRGANREIGSGESIMGYAGVTGTHDVTTQEFTLGQFHHFNLTQINSYLANQTCGYSSPSTNTPPVADVGSRTTYQIPKGTAVKLVGSATDADGDTLTYSWEQSNPLTTNTGSNFKNSSSFNTDGANFRIKQHSTDPVGYFPPLQQVLNGNLRTTWNTVSDVQKNMIFAFQVRDNNPQGGQIDAKNVSLLIRNVGPFQITGIDLNQTLIPGEPFNLTWDVAGTDANGINVQNVAIKLTTDKGQTFTTLVESTPNNGQASITIPSDISAESANIIVEAIGNVFYAASPEVAINYEISLDCQTIETSTTYNIPDRVGTQNGAVLVNLPANTGYTGTIEDLSVKTDITHPNSNQLSLYFMKVNTDRSYINLYNRSCDSSVPNVNFIFSSKGGNLYDNCGVDFAHVTGTTVDFNNYIGANVRGTYRLIVNDNVAGLTGTINKVTIEACSRTATTLSVGDLVKNKEFGIFPNPNNGNFNIRLETKAPNFTADILNMAGQTVSTQKINTTSTSVSDYRVNVSHLPKGVYIVNVNDGNQTQSKKLIIK